MNITYFEMNRILNHVFTSKTSASYAYTAGSFAMGLSTSEVYVSGSGTTEPSSLYGYARVRIISGSTSWTVADTTGTIDNIIPIEFTASGSAWGTIRSIFLSTELTAGSVCYYYTLPTPFPVLGNTNVTFASGSVTISMA